MTLIRSLFFAAIKQIFPLVLLLCWLGFVVAFGLFIFLPMRTIMIWLMARGWNRWLAVVLWLPIPGALWMLWAHWRDAHPATAFDRWLSRAVHWTTER